ncbi:MAG TPA: hypothetical protein DD491_06895 [Halieaceae bacterium]|nr:hypothetical protein [Halieaceae bacterium]|tara:strand:+ start:107 stop:337 length:231 start_codon:yes stop_codon:yes gene_type:complete
MVIEREAASNTPCDLCRGTEMPAAYACVAQGASGRWCEVLWLDENCARKVAGEQGILSPDEARARVAEMPGAWAEF